MYFKDNKGRAFVAVSSTEAVGNVPAMTTLFSCADTTKVVLRTQDFERHIERGLFVKFVPETQNHAGV